VPLGSFGEADWIIAVPDGSSSAARPQSCQRVSVVRWRRSTCAGDDVRARDSRNIGDGSRSQLDRDRKLSIAPSMYRVTYSFQVRPVPYPAPNATEFEMTDHIPSALRRVLAAVAVLLVLAYLVLIPLGVIHNQDRLGTPEALLATVLLVVFLFHAQNSYSIRDLTVGSSGIAASFERIDARQSALESDVRALQVTLTGLVTKFELVHLENLASEGPATVRFSQIMISELEHLDAMQFVRPTHVHGLNAIREEHGSGLDDFDLRQYVEITGEGREYLTLRAMRAARTARERASS
jgi:hypothetical protein